MNEYSSIYLLYWLALVYPGTLEEWYASYKDSSWKTEPIKEAINMLEKYLSNH